jgi:hypothetical protein
MNDSTSGSPDRAKWWSLKRFIIFEFVACAGVGLVAGTLGTLLVACGFLQIHSVKNNPGFMSFGPIDKFLDVLARVIPFGCGGVLVGAVVVTATLIYYQFGRFAGLSAGVAGAAILLAGWVSYFHNQPPMQGDAEDLQNYLGSYLYRRGCTVDLSSGTTPEMVSWRAPDRPLLPGCPGQSGMITISKQSSPEEARRWFERWESRYVVHHSAFFWADVVFFGEPEEVEAIRAAFP